MGRIIITFQLDLVLNVLMYATCVYQYFHSFISLQIACVRLSFVIIAYDFLHCELAIKQMTSQCGCASDSASARWRSTSFVPQFCKVNFRSQNITYLHYSPPRNLTLLFLKKLWKVGRSQKKLETVMICSLS